METLREGAKRLRFDLSSEQEEAFRLYLQRILAEREQAALSSLKESEAIQRRHFLESLALLRALEDTGAWGPSAIDIGAGAGFPGLPIKIVRPELRLTLLEATAKKADFLRRLVEHLGLKDTVVIHCRAEELAHSPDHRAGYHLALARAVAPLPVLVELALPFLSLGGYLAAPKGSAAQREVAEAAAALRWCGGQVQAVLPLDLPEAKPAPTLVLIRKVAETPERFPRRPGIPTKRPLR